MIEELIILLSVDLKRGTVTNSTRSIPTAMWMILGGLEMEVVMVLEVTILLNVDLTKGIVMSLTTRTVMCIILSGLEMEVVIIFHLTILLSADLTVATAESRKSASLH